MKIFEGVFTDVGKQLKQCALILFSIGAIIGILIGIGFLFAEFTFANILLGSVLVILILLAAWCSTVLLYAFGELVDKVSTISAQIAEFPSQNEQSDASENP